MAPIARLIASPETGRLCVQALGQATERELRWRLADFAIRRQGRQLLLDAFEATSLLDWPDRHSVFEWASDSERFLENRRHVLDVHVEVKEAVESLRSGGSKAARSLLGDDPRLVRLDDHQWVNVAAATLPQSFGLCIFDEQGAGKTVTTIFAHDLLAERRQVRGTVIVSPKSMLPEWKHDIERFMGDLYRVVVLTGSRSERQAALASMPDIVVAGYETVASMLSELEDYANQLRGLALLVVDESFNVKNHDARRTKAARRLREAFARAIVLCGTPAPNTPSDLIAQFDLVDFGFTFRGVDVPDDRDDAVPAVRSAIEARGLFLRHLKQDVIIDLPSKTFHQVRVPFESVQGALYRAVLGELIADLEGIDDHHFKRNLANYLARRAALLRLCSDPAGVVEGYREIPAKLIALDALLGDWIGNRREKVVLWSFYTNTVTACVERYGDYGTVRFDGTVTSVVDRGDAVRRFQDDDETMLFVGNAGAAGAGLTLHRARLAVYESMSNQAAHFLQSVDRIHRRGQTRDVEYAVLLCDGSIEEAEFDRIVAKDRRARDLLGDVAPEQVTRDVMLNELLRSAGRLDEVVKS